MTPQKKLGPEQASRAQDLKLRAQLRGKRQTIRRERNRLDSDVDEISLLLLRWKRV